VRDSYSDAEAGRNMLAAQPNPAERNLSEGADMATRKKKSSRSKTTRSRGATDAVTLLKNDHREVEQWFEQFEKTRSDDRKATLAQKICQALTVHAQIEEEIFYPAFIEATEEEDLHHEAIVEHDGAKKLIAQIEGSSPSDDYFDARVTVLSEMIKHHVKEEEQRDGMFAKAKQAQMDLVALGEQLAARKAELMGGATGGRNPQRRARGNSPTAAMP
jgi:hemerythrin superfamily protein